MSRKSSHKPTELTSRRRRRRSTSSPRGWSPSRRLRFEPLEDRRLLAVIPVTNLDDFGPGSLRQAIFDANNKGGADTIDLTGVAGTINVALGEMEITEEVILDGPGAGRLMIDAGQNSRIFNFNTTLGDFTVRGLTLTGGRTTGDGVNVVDDTYSGGAIRFLGVGTLAIEQSVITGNSTQGDFADGGAIFSDTGEVTLTDSTLTVNSTAGDSSEGGGISTGGGDVALTNSTLSHNSTIGQSSEGGGIHTASGEVVLTGSTLSGNFTLGANSNGGGILAAFGHVTITDSAISGNSTAGDYSAGGGIRTASGDVTITNSTISDNRTAGYRSRGGGIQSTSGTVTITNSTISGNSTTGDDSKAGAIAIVLGAVTLENSTVSGNSTAGDDSPGGAVYILDGALTLNSSTLTENNTSGASSDGGGIHLDPLNNPSLTIQNSIVSGNTVGAGSSNDDIDPGTVSLDVNYSLIGVDPGGIVGVGNITGMQPNLGPLAFNGGPTQTHALLAGSLGIDAADPAVAFNPAEFDQRGAPFVRVADGGVAGVRIDMGAFERQDLGGTLVVDTTVDESDGDFSVGDLSLREAVELANGTDVDTIEFDPVVFATPQTILLELGEIQIGEGVTIDGPGADLLTIDAQQNSRIFNIVAETGDVTLRGMTLTGGRTIGENQFGDFSFSGGAIRSISSGRLTIENSVVGDSSTQGDRASGGGVAAIFDLALVNSVVSGNSTAGDDAKGGGLFSAEGDVALTGSLISGNSTAGVDADGGGVYSFNGDITIVGSTISGNHTEGFASSGGGVFKRNGTVALTDSTVWANSTAGDYGTGGGIRSGTADVTLTRSTVSENSTAGYRAKGGGIYSQSSGLTLIGSTISGNGTEGDEAEGGGIYSRFSDVTLVSSTLARNSTEGNSARGGGIFVNDTDSDPTLTIQNSIVADNAVGAGSTNPDLFHDANGVFDPDYSLIGDTSGLTAPQIFAIPLGNGNLTNVDPLLGPLAYNGGPTETHALLAGSPAIDAGDPSIASVPDEFDQRGDPFLRVRQGMQGSAVVIDMGAYERQGIPNPRLVVDTAVDESDGDYSAGDLSLREALGLANGDLGANTITFSPSLIGATISLVLGQLDVTDSVSIEGLRANQLTIDAQQGSRVFNIDDGDNTAHHNVTISGLTITGGEVEDDGAGIRSRENLDLIESLVSGNSATGTGLATGINGGGVYLRMFGGMAVAISGSTIAGNSTAGTGGGIHVLSGAGDTLEITNSTISGNEADLTGGGMLITGSGTTNIAHSTIAFNTADANMTGFGGVGGIFDSSGLVTLDHTIVSSNIDTTGPENDLDGTFTANYSLIGDTSGAAINGSNNILNLNARLEPLADNGGPTPTHALMDVSPALNSGNIGIVSPPQFDQRGFPFTRVFGIRIDRGAFEDQPLPPAFFGDYNQNGVVDAPDYTVWRDTLGLTGVAPYSGADGNGDGMITANDYGVWVSHFGQVLALPGAASGPIAADVIEEPLALVELVAGDDGPAETAMPNAAMTNRLVPTSSQVQPATNARPQLPTTATRNLALSSRAVDLLLAVADRALRDDAPAAFFARSSRGTDDPAVDDAAAFDLALAALDAEL